MTKPWRTAPLIALADYLNGYAFKPEDHTDEGLPIIRIEQLKDDNAEIDHYNKSVPENNLIRNGDLIFSWSASLFLRIWDRGDAILNQHLFKVVPYDDVDKRYLKYCIEFNLPKLANSSHGSTMKHITRKELKRFHVSLPSEKTEQEKIAKILATIDRAIAQTEALIAKHKRIKTGLMQDLLTRGVDEHGQLRDVSTHRFKSTPLGMIPVEWEVNQLKYYLSYISYGFTNPMPEADDGPYLITAANVIDGKIDYQSCRHTTQDAYKRLLTAKSRPNKDDILLTKDGTLGRLAIVDDKTLCINQSVAVLRTNNKVEPAFLKTLLESSLYQKLMLDDAGGSTIKHIYVSKIDKMYLAMPKEIEERQRLMEIISCFEKKFETRVNELDKLLKLKQGLMQDLLSGRVPVTGLVEGGAG
jgi:type I restriction enzyme S subunit